MPPTRERRWWTSDEDEILKEQVQIQSQNAASEDASVQNWNEVALSLPGRTNKDCRKRWSKIQQAIRKGTWTQEEDARLQQAVSRLGFRWSQVATIVQDRNADQCAKRWQHVLGPEFKHSPWTPAEDAKLLKGVAQHGNNWKQIGTSELPDRSSHDIRNRSLLLERRSRNKTVKQLNPSHDVDHTVDKHADGSERYEFKNDDNNTRDDHSDYATPDSLIPQLPPEITRGSLVKHYTTPAAEPMGCHGAERLRYPQRPSNVTQGVHESLGLGWTGSVEHSQPHPELLTPEDIRMSWLDPFQASASSLTRPQYPWWSGTPTEELNFHNPGSLDMGLFSLPETNTDLSGRESIHDSLDVVEGPSHDESGRDDDGRGSITLTLDQVDPVVARRIIGSVLEHSAGHKIQYIFNAT